jgi:uncharacterized protein (TIRG00374 family)
MTTAAKPRLTKRVLLFVSFGLLAFLLYLYYLVGLTNIADTIGRTNLLYYSLAFIAFVVSIAFLSLSWHSLLDNLTIQNSIRKDFQLVWVGMFFDAVVPEPGWTGDLLRAYVMSKTSNQDAGTIAASVIGQKIIGMAVTVIDLVLGLTILAFNYSLPSSVSIFIAFVLFLSAFSLFIVVYFSSKPKATKKVLDWLIRFVCFVRRGRWNPTSFRTRAQETLGEFHEGIRALSGNLKALVRPIAFSLVSWAFDVSVIFVVFASLRYPIPIDKVLIVYALTGSLQAIGVSLVGFTEIVVSSSYAILGLPIAVSTSATLLTRIVTLWFKLVVSYVAFQWTGVELLMGQQPKNIDSHHSLR